MSVQITVIPHKVNQGVFATVVHLSVEAAYVLGAIILHLCKTSEFNRWSFSINTMAIV